MKIRYLGHSFFNISFPNANVLIDPYLMKQSEDSNLEPLLKSPCDKAGLCDIAMILITHEHFDHFDKELIENIAMRDNAIVMSHESILSELSLPKNLIKPISAGNTISTRGLTVTATPAHHPTAFYPQGYLIDSEGSTVFHAGDTSLHDSFANITADVALLPIGGTYTMDIVDAVRATKTMKPKFVIPMHYNTFDVIKADPNEFKSRIEKSILKTKPVILAPGETAEL